MPYRLQADVVVTVYRDAAMTTRCLKSVLAHSGPVLRSLIVVDDVSPEPDMPAALAEAARSDPRVRVVTNEANLGYIGTCNRGLRERRADAVLLNSDTIVTPGWLSELAEVAHSDPRTACVSPLSNNASICSVPAFCDETPSENVDVEAVRAACAGLPRWTEIPTGNGFCLYLPGHVLDLVGLFDPIFAPCYNEENDWSMRAQAMGFVAKRANRAFVYHLGSRAYGEGKRALEERSSRLLAGRHPHYRPQVDRFYFTLDSRLPAHAVRVETTGRTRVALDLRHVLPNQIGRATYEIGLARALSKRPEVELTLAVRDPRQAAGVPARLAFGDHLLEDVEVIHKPAPVLDRTDLQFLFGSPSHTVITHLDLTAYRAQRTFPNQDAADRYRATTALALQAAQAVIAVSEDARGQIVAEFGLPAAEVAVTPPGMEHERFARGSEHDYDLLRGRVPSGPFLLSVAADAPHKNLRNLIEAYTLVRREWTSPGEPPALVLVGNQAGRKDGSGRNHAKALPPGITYLGAVTDVELSALYRSAEAIVFPSVYQGFGLPILRAMAAGTPVIAMPSSGISEVADDCLLYPDGLSTADLARAIERLSTDEALRDGLRDSGSRWVKRFTWEATARATCQAYRAAVLRPSDRSLRMRRLIHADLLRAPEPMGIRNACNALNHAVSRRLQRDIKRLPAVVGLGRA